MLGLTEMDRRWQRHGLWLGAFFLLFEAAVWGSGSTGFLTALLSGISASLFAGLMMLLVAFVHSAD